MEFKTSRLNGGTEIKVYTDQEIALVVKTGGGERIYLPDYAAEDSTYYAEEPETLMETDYGYRVLHRGNVEDVEIIG